MALPGRVAAGFALAIPIAAIGWVDVVTGPQYGMSLFYVLPVAFAGWFFGYAVGASTAIQGALWWFCVDRAQNLVSSPLASAWNGFTRLAIFLAIGIGAALIHGDRKRLKSLLEREASLARVDPLTGLQNGRAFREHVTQDLARARRDEKAVTLMYIDIDNFKRVNDRHGHAAGDALLAEIAAVIRRTLRESDHAARLGGDEFALLLWDADTRIGDLVAKRLIDDIRALGDAYPESSLGASAGLSTISSSHTTAEALLHEADQAMYEVKRAGKGRVRASVPPTA